MWSGGIRSDVSLFRHLRSMCVGSIHIAPDWRQEYRECLYRKIMPNTWMQVFGKESSGWRILVWIGAFRFTPARVSRSHFLLRWRSSEAGERFLLSR